MQRLRQLALQRPGARRGRCSQMYDGVTDVKTRSRLREFAHFGQINTRPLSSAETGAPVITSVCFFAGEAPNLQRTLRLDYKKLDSCSRDQVFHSDQSQPLFDSPTPER